MLNPAAGIEKKEIKSLLNRDFPEHLVVPGFNPWVKKKETTEWFYTEEERATPFAIPESLDPPPVTPEQQARLQELQELPIIKNNSTYAAIMAVPEIAEAEAERCSEQKDQEGFRHLASLMRRYHLSTQKDSRPDPYMLPIEFPLKFPRFTFALKQFVDADQQGNVISDNGLRTLYNILIREGYLTGEGKELNALELNPKQWEKFYFNQALVEGHNFRPDGLMAALADCAIRALPICRTERMPNGRYKVHVEDIAIYMRDVFNFEGWARLDAWSKGSKDFRIWSLGSYENLYNSDFREFTAETRIGKDFEVLSNPLRLKIRPFSFEVDPRLAVKRPSYADE